MPNLKIIVQTKEIPINPDDSGLFLWEDLEKMDTDDVEEEYAQRLSDICVNDCCSLIFTSGTTGRPKVSSLFF